MTLTIGIDPGATGAVALLDGEDLAWVHDMPYLDKHVSAPALAELLISPHRIDVVWVEKAQAMPNQGVSSSFNYGRGVGAIDGVLGAMNLRTEYVRPNVWKRAMGLSQDKDASRRRAIELWPHKAHLFKRVKDDGRAEACLIALYGFRLRAHDLPTAPPAPWATATTKERSIV